MLESLVATLLNRLLGQYILNFDPTQLQVGIFQGSVGLHNLQLRREALDQLALPLDVVAGQIGLLELNIPWTNPYGKPVRIKITDLVVLAVPRTDSAGSNPATEAERALRVKLEKLTNADLQRDRVAGVVGPDKKTDGFASSLAAAIVDNLQIEVSGIHIRYEDALSVPAAPFAVGLTLDRFLAVRTDESFSGPTDSKTESPSGMSHKLVELDALAVYWDSKTSLMSSGRSSDVRKTDGQPSDQTKTSAEIAADLKKMLSAPENHQYLLQPVSGHAHLELNKTGRTDRPRVRALLGFDQLAFVLDRLQYRDGLRLADLFAAFFRRRMFADRPTVAPSDDPLRWFQYAARTVLAKVSDKHRRTSWAYIRERRDDRKRYVELFAGSSRDGARPSPAEAEEKDELEKKYEYEDLRFWRSLAWAQLRREQADIKPENRQTWGQWLWGQPPTGTEAGQSGDVVDTAEAEQQRKELYEIINWDEKQVLADAVELPAEYVKYELGVRLGRGSFTLAEHGADGPLSGDVGEGKVDIGPGRRAIARLLYDDLRTKVKIRPAESWAQIELAGMSLFDGTTPGTLFPEIITMKDGPVEEAVGNVYDDLANPFFHLALSTSSAEDRKVDSTVAVKLRATQVIYNPLFISALVRFFRPAEAQLPAVGILLDSANEAVAGIRKQTRAGLQYALDQHVSVDLTLDVRAPLIVLPDTVTTEATLCLIVDAGHMQMHSEIADGLGDGRVDRPDMTAAEVERLLYDRFRLRLTDTQVLLGRSVEEARAALVNPARPLHLVDQITIDFVLETCIVAATDQWAQVRLRAAMPELQARLSDWQYRGIVRLADLAIPDTSDDFAVATRMSLWDDGFVDALDLDDHHDEPKKESVSDTWKKRWFELEFDAGRLQAAVFRAEEKLVELVAEDFRLGLTARQYDLEATVRLRRLGVDEFVGDVPLPGLEHKLVFSGATPSPDADELLSVKVVRTSVDSPEFEARGRVGIDVGVEVSTIQTVVSRKTVLTLLDFVVQTFAPPGDSAESSASSVSSESESGPGSIRVRASLARMAFLLNEDGAKLATGSLDSASVLVDLSPDGTLAVQSQLADMRLMVEDQPLVTLRAGQPTKVDYRTFAQVETGFNAELIFRSAVTVQFEPEPVQRLLVYLVQFGRMHGVFATARAVAVEQVSAIQKVGQVRVDAVVERPTVVFPDRAERSNGTARIVADQAFFKTNPADPDKIETGIRKVALTFDSGRDGAETETVVEGVDLMFSATLAEAIRASGSCSPVRLRLSKEQARFAVWLAGAVPAAVAIPDLPAVSDLGSVPSTSAIEPPEPVDGDGRDVEFDFSLPAAEIELLRSVGGAGKSGSGIARVAVETVGLAARRVAGRLSGTLKATSTGVIDAAVSEVLRDAVGRAGAAMDLTGEDVGGGGFSVLVERAEAVLRVETVGEIRSFALYAIDGLSSSTPATSTSTPSVPSAGVASPPVSQPMSVSVVIARPRLAIVPPNSIADVHEPEREAIVLSGQRIIAARQDSITAAAEKVALFLVRPEKTLRVVDDLDVILSVESVAFGSGSSSHSVKAHVDVGELVMRLSVAEMAAVAAVVTGVQEWETSPAASPSRSPAVSPSPVGVGPGRSARTLASSQSSKRMIESRSSLPSDLIQSSATAAVQAAEEPLSPLSASIRSERLTLEIGGIRLVVLGGPHLLPVASITVPKTRAEVSDWSGRLLASVPVAVKASVYNFGEDAWEPLVEPWSVRLRAERRKGRIVASIDAHDRLELTVTPAAVVAGRLVGAVLSGDRPDTTRADDDDGPAPYRILNLTGFPVRVRAAQSKSNRETDLADGAEVSWRFAGADATRETLSAEAVVGALEIDMTGSPFESVGPIPVRAEGERVFRLRRTDSRSVGFIARLMADVKLQEDGVKRVVLRSPWLIENTLGRDVEVGVAEAQFPEGVNVFNRIRANSSGVVAFGKDVNWRIRMTKVVRPGGLFAVPVESVFFSALVFRPATGGYGWSSVVRWDGGSGMVTKPVQTVKCPRTDKTACHIHITAQLTGPKGKFPALRVRLVPPVRIQNLLPFPVRFVVRDPDAKVSWDKNIASSEIGEVTVVDPDGTLTLGIITNGEEAAVWGSAAFRRAECENAFISGRDRDVYQRENVLKVLDPATRALLKLRLLYRHRPEDGMAFTVAVFPPYMIENRLGIEIRIADTGMFGPGVLAGRGSCPPNRPTMASLEEDRMRIQTGTSDHFSDPVALDAAKVVTAVVPVSRSKSMLVGVVVSEGSGPFRIVRQVTIGNLFAVKNCVDHDILVRPARGSDIVRIPAQSARPVEIVGRQGAVSSLAFCLSGLGAKWSAEVEGERPPAEIQLVGPDNEIVRLAVRADPSGPTTVVVLSEATTTLSGPTRPEPMVEANLSGLGLSIVARREIVYATLSGISGTIFDSGSFSSAKLAVQTFQVDNQLFGAAKPVAVSGHGLGANVSWSKSSTTKSATTMIPTAELKVAPVAVAVDEDLIYALLNFFQTVAGTDSTTTAESGGPVDLLIGNLDIAPLAIDFSFSRSERLSSENRSAGPGNPLAFLVHVLTFSIGNINSAPLRFPGFSRKEMRCRIPALIGAIQSHYVASIHALVPAVVGSAELLGNPVGLFTALASGVADIFHEPYAEMTTVSSSGNPVYVGRGIGRGAYQLVSKTVTGFSSSFAGFTRSLSNGLAAASMDSEFQDRRRIAAATAASRNRPALASAGEVFASTFADSIAGLGREPIAGAEQGGILGLGRGLGKAVLGIATKPAAGMLDVASSLAAELRDSASGTSRQRSSPGGSNLVGVGERVRMPRVVPRFPPVPVFSPESSLGQSLLKTAGGGKYFAAEYFAHVSLPGSDTPLGISGSPSGLVMAGGTRPPPTPSEVIESAASISLPTSGRTYTTNGGKKSGRLLFITYDSLLLLHAKSLSTEWATPLAAVRRIAKERSGIAIIRLDGPGPFIEIVNPAERAWVYECIAVVVGEWNSQWDGN